MSNAESTVGCNTLTLMPENSADVCPNCGVQRIAGVEICHCGYNLTQAPPVNAGAAYPRGSYAPGFGADPNAGPSITDRLIPTKNPKALIAYYCGVFALVPCFSPILGPVALILGILGVRECKKIPGLPGKGHAITGIVLGSITTALTLLGVGLILYGIVTQRK